MPHTFDEKELLDRVDNDWELLGDTVHMLTEDAPGLLAEVRRAVEAGDTTAVGRAAHTLKGMISNFCAADAQASAASLEQIGKGGDLSGATPALHELEFHVRALTAELTDFVAAGA